MVMMEKERKIPDLTWTKADYLMANIEVPDSLIEDYVHTEGELMNESEIADWLVDTQKTFIILKQENHGVFEKLYQKYVIDIHYLRELGKITVEDEDDLLNLNQFEI